MVTDRRNCQRNQRHDAALAFVVGAHDEDHVFEGHDDHQRPENRGDTAQYVRRGERYAVAGVEYFLYRIQWTGADVAVDHAKSGQCQRTGATTPWIWAIRPG